MELTLVCISTHSSATLSYNEKTRQTLSIHFKRRTNKEDKLKENENKSHIVTLTSPAPRSISSKKFLETDNSASLQRNSVN